MKFFTDISLWWTIPMAVLAFALSGWYYLTKAQQSTFSTLVRRSLFVLRGTGIFLILLLLIGILLQSIRFRSEKPVLAILVDQSVSMLNYGDSADFRASILPFLTDAEMQLAEKMDIAVIPFSSEVEDTITASFAGKTSDISKAFRHVRESFLHRNLGAVLLVSDGNFNQGLHPRFELEKFDFTPVYALAVGDTLTKRDAALVNVSANQIAFQGNIFPVKVEAIATKLQGKNLTVTIEQGSRVLAEKTILLASNAVAFSETFQIQASGKGVQAFVVRLNVNEKEYTLENNLRTVYIEVLDSKRKVLILSGGINPDIGALQSVLQKDKNTDVEMLLFKDVREIPRADLIILHNPVNPYSQPIWTAVKNGETPFLVIAGTSGDVNQYNQLELGMSGVAQGKFDAAFASVSSEFNLIRFSDEFKKRMVEFPPLSVPFARNFTEIGSSLLYQRIGSVKTERPLLSVVERGGRKYAVLYGEGIWRWKISEYNKYQNNQAFEELWDKLLQYLTVKRNTEKLRVFPPVQVSDRDELVFRAEFYNDAFQLITEPNVQLVLADASAKKLADYSFSARNADYVLNIGKLTGGLYNWKASTTYNGKRYEKEGDLVVSEVSQEKIKLTADYGVLNELAEMHKGKFLTWKERNQALTDLQSREDIQSVRFEESAFSNLLDYKWILFLICALFFAEWVIRRWYGSL